MEATVLGDLPWTEDERVPQPHPTCQDEVLQIWDALETAEETCGCSALSQSANPQFVV